MDGPDVEPQEFTPLYRGGCVYEQFFSLPKERKEHLRRLISLYGIEGAKEKIKMSAEKVGWLYRAAEKAALDARALVGLAEVAVGSEEEYYADD